MTKIGIFPGAFDPITKGHLQIIEMIICKGLVDKLYVMPCYSHMFNKKMTPAWHRYTMACLGVSFLGLNYKVIVTPFEIENEFKQVSSYDILHIFCDEYNIPPNNFPYIIIGLDNANNINLWKYNEILIDTFPFIVIPRKFEKDIKEDGWYTKEPHILVRDSEIIEDSEMMDCSSTKVRELIKNNADFKDIPITFDVYSYIKNNGFYT